MSRARYLLYVAARTAEALAVAGAGALLLGLLEARGLVRPPGAGWAGPLSGALGVSRAAVLEFLDRARLLACAAAAHVLLGPKQERPVYRRHPGAMYAYAGVTVDRGGGCRGGLVTGSTGSGKTLSCILPRLHSLCVNEPGTERTGWRESRAGRRFAEAARVHRTAGRRPAGDPRESLLALREAGWTCRDERYRAYPWGGFICGEKGNEWRLVEALLGAHGRPEDACVLATRPAGDPSWEPQARLNLLSMASVPADTYARLIVETALSVEEAAKADEFFVPQARDKIAWGLRLTRAAASAGSGPLGPSLLTLLDILTVPASYRRYLDRCAAECPASALSGPFAEARFQLENNYWNQPPDQLGGVRGTVYNFLAPFAEDEVAEVFCGDSTVDLRDMERGRVFCLAIPQRHALQRRYVATILKALCYQVVLQRFDRGPGDPSWTERNVILVEQDEWQRHAVRADCDVDVVREASGAVYAAAQSQNAVWLRMGGRERASPVIANLRNRWICQAATEECAEESSRVLSGRVARELSYSEGAGGRTTNVSFPERPVLPLRELRRMRPFEVVFAPAEGPWLYRRCLAMPAAADGTIPDWWFGHWNPLHWAARALGLPERAWGFRLHPGRRLVPPWRAAAPARAQLRWLLGLDGTFILLGGRRREG